MDDFPENPWRDDQVLLGGLAIVNQTLAAFLQNLMDVKQGKAEPFTAVQTAIIGSSMVETGNALQSRIVNNLPKDWPAPPINVIPLRRVRDGFERLVVPRGGYAPLGQSVLQLKGFLEDLIIKCYK